MEGAGLDFHNDVVDAAFAGATSGEGGELKEGLGTVKPGVDNRNTRRLELLAPHLVCFHAKE